MIQLEVWVIFVEDYCLGWSLPLHNSLMRISRDVDPEEALELCIHIISYSTFSGLQESYIPVEYEVKNE